MRRREFIGLLSGAAVAWPLAARAQHADPVRHVGVIYPLDPSDQVAQSRLSALRERLEALGWTEGRNLRIDERRPPSESDQLRAVAAELVGLAPDVIVAYGPPALAALHRETRSIPIVFTQVSNVLGAGFVASMARPGGNITGFSNFELSIGGKWLQTLKEIAPRVTRAAVILNPDNTSSSGFLGSIEAAASSLGI